jgi:hypothetical protein
MSFAYNNTVLRYKLAITQLGCILCAEPSSLSKHVGDNWIFSIQTLPLSHSDCHRLLSTLGTNRDGSRGRPSSVCMQVRRNHKHPLLAYRQPVERTSCDGTWGDEEEIGTQRHILTHSCVNHREVNHRDTQRASLKMVDQLALTIIAHFHRQTVSTTAECYRRLIHACMAAIHAAREGQDRR